MADKTIEEYLEDSAYRKSVGIVLHKGSKVFFAERKDAKGAWQMPQGGIDEGEDFLDAARRELFEETALTREQMELIAICPEWVVYTLPKKYQKKGFKGQIQKWFLFKFNDDDKNIDLAKAQDDEFTDWRWENRDTILKEVESFRKPVYENIFKVFSSRIDNAS